MWRASISNHAFNRMGERYAPVIDREHFLGRSAFDIHYPKPPVNIVQQSDKLYEMNVFVPGFEKEDITIEVNNNVMIIKGERKNEMREEKNNYVLEELDFNSFQRSFKLSPTIAKEKITAIFKNGVLTLTFIDVPEAEERTMQTVEVQ